MAAFIHIVDVAVFSHYNFNIQLCKSMSNTFLWVFVVRLSESTVSLHMKIASQVVSHSFLTILEDVYTMLV